LEIMISSLEARLLIMSYTIGIPDLTHPSSAQGLQLEIIQAIVM